MKINQLLKQLEGTQTIESVKSILNIKKNKAIYYIYRLRKQGYVKTRRINNRRVYSISFENKLKGSNYYDIINKNSPIKLAAPKIYKIYGKEPTIEETLIYAVKTGSLRTMLASIALFKKIKDWGNLYRLAKKNHIKRQIGALYDLARKLFRTRKMTKRFRNNSVPKKDSSFEYAIKGMKSRDFKDIESTWKIYLPFNRKDFEEYA